jgi:uncharacterized protein YjbJ (UPF0337 family)
VERALLCTEVRQRPQTKENNTMATGAEHRGKGIVEQAKGAIKEGYGALTGDRSTELEGKAERVKGSIRESYGKLKEDLTRNDDDLNKPPK